MEYIKTFESYNEEYSVQVADRFIDNKEYENLLYWFREYYGDPDTAENELHDWIGTVKRLYKSGGKLYRLVYVNDISEINKDNLGHHWGISYFDVKDLADGGWRDKFGENKEKGFIIEVKTEPKNISVKNVDISGNPEEKEVNVIDHNKIEIVNIEEV